MLQDLDERTVVAAAQFDDLELLCRLVPERVEQVSAPLECEQQQVHHPEGERIGSEIRTPMRFSHNGMRTAFHRPMEYLGHDSPPTPVSRPSFIPASRRVTKSAM
jgi:hypothetical protein